MIFSVIIPCYNSEKSVVRALDSVVNQTFKDFEIVIVDDGSNDNTKTIIHKYFKNQKNIKYKYMYQKNSGPSKARNYAVKNSVGKYLSFLDSDDEWHKDKLQIQYDCIQKLKIKFVSSSYTINEFKDIENISIKEFIFNDFLISNRTSTPCTVIERNLFEEVGGFDESLSYSEDYNLWLKISLKETLVFIDVPLVKLYKKPYGESGLSSHMWKMEKGELYNYKYLYKMKYINFLTYNFLITLSILKYIKRRIFG
ncbi:MAG: glycosyltransferase family 2 protein [Arcobacteraceae bacterium]|nr:glycosyltransferase family 2 protein [Arcobacteraceae bacterium]